MTDGGGPLVPRLPVLTDENVWPEFSAVIAALGQVWRAASGRLYRLHLEGSRLDVYADDIALGAMPTGEQIDTDLLELACLVQDRVPGEWSGESLRRVAAVWGWETPG